MEPASRQKDTNGILWKCMISWIGLEVESVEQSGRGGENIFHLDEFRTHGFKCFIKFELM